MKLIKRTKYLACVPIEVFRKFVHNVYHMCIQLFVYLYRLYTLYNKLPAVRVKVLRVTKSPRERLSPFIKKKYANYFYPLRTNQLQLTRPTINSRFILSTIFRTFRECNTFVRAEIPDHAVFLKIADARNDSSGHLYSKF